MGFHRDRQWGYTSIIYIYIYIYVYIYTDKDLGYGALGVSAWQLGSKVVG